jgi:hypothetical protein
MGDGLRPARGGRKLWEGLFRTRREFRRLPFDTTMDRLMVGGW